jgi:AraC-like DNA-binding protein
MSEANFFRYFKKITGFSPIQYIKNIRLQKAYYLIKTEKLLLKEVAKKV